MELYLKNALNISRVTTRNYSTSFSLGVRTLNRKYRPAIYAIYGFVRFADEIVDTFHQFDKDLLIAEFRRDTFKAIEEKISTNPILHSFQYVVHEYNIPMELIESFLDSMEMDLHYHQYGKEAFKEYVYGSAEVVGLMCLKVFYKNNEEEFERLKHPARKLGEAFQKVNFLRDIKADYKERGRMYFPNVNFDSLSVEQKKEIEADIEKDFNEAFAGITQLHEDVLLGVYLSYRYYRTLFNKIKRTKPQQVLAKRYRINNMFKLWLLFKSSVRYQLNMF